MYVDTVGYGVMPEVSKWSSRIKSMTNWLLDEEACPTDNEWILEECTRLNEVAARAERRGEPA